MNSEVEWAFGLFDCPALDRVGIQHCGSDIAVPQQFLYRTNIIIGLQQMTGETMTKSVGGSALGDFGLVDCAFNGLLNMSFMKMVAPVFIGTRNEG